MASVFCPNCGTQNDSSAMPCKNCGFKLSGVSAPKFKGTMMLNSDQSVQDLIEEHKKKLQEGSAASGSDEPPEQAPAPGSPAQGPSGTRISAAPGAPRGISEPPRAAPKAKRMGATMLGVAPQVGGVTPPKPAVPQVAKTEQPFGAVNAPAPPGARPVQPRAAAGLARTMALPGAPAPPPATLDPTPLAGPAATRPLPRTDEPAAPAAPIAAAPHPRQNFGTVPLPLADTAAVSVERAPAPPAPAASSDVATALEPLPGNGTWSPSESAALAEPRGLKPWEIFLIVATCGLYGVVLLVMRRRPPAPRA